MALRRVPRSLVLACLAALSLAGCESRQAPAHPLWSHVRQVSPPLRSEDARLVLHVPEFARGRVLIALDKDRLRLSHEVTVVHLPAGEYEFVLGYLGAGTSVGMSFPVELAKAQTRYYHVALPAEGERALRIRERSRDELVAGFVRRDPFIRSYTSVTGAFRRALRRRDNPR